MPYVFHVCMTNMYVMMGLVCMACIYNICMQQVSVRTGQGWTEYDSGRRRLHKTRSGSLGVSVAVWPGIELGSGSDWAARLAQVGFDSARAARIDARSS